MTSADHLFKAETYQNDRRFAVRLGSRKTMSLLGRLFQSRPESGEDEGVAIAERLLLRVLFLASAYELPHLGAAPLYPAELQPDRATRTSVHECGAVLEELTFLLEHFDDPLLTETINACVPVVQSGLRSASDLDLVIEGPDAWVRGGTFLGDALFEAETYRDDPEYDVLLVEPGGTLDEPGEGVGRPKPLLIPERLFLRLLYVAKAYELPTLCGAIRELTTLESNQTARLNSDQCLAAVVELEVLKAVAHDDLLARTIDMIRSFAARCGKNNGKLELLIDGL